MIDEYIVVKIEKYSNEKNQNIEDLKSNLVLAGFFAINFIYHTMIYSNNVANDIDPNWHEYVSYWMRYVSLVIGSTALILLLRSIMKNIGLSHKIDELEALLQQIHPLEQEKGKRL